MQIHLILTPVSETITTTLRNSGKGDILAPSVRLFWLNGVSYVSIKDHGDVPQFYSMKGDSRVLEVYATPHEHYWNGYCNRVPPEGECRLLQIFCAYDDKGEFSINLIPHKFASVAEAFADAEERHQHHVSEKEHYDSSISFLICPCATEPAWVDKEARKVIAANRAWLDAYNAATPAEIEAEYYRNESQREQDEQAFERRCEEEAIAATAATAATASSSICG